MILLASAFLRLSNLSYSHFQGDEIKALYPLDAAFPDFLFDQNKGPMQFLVTLAVSLVTGGYEESITRIPFALASLATVYLVFRIAREHWGRNVALLSAALVGTCGLLTALGRIVQYQSFCVLFVVLTAYLLLKALSFYSPKLLYIAGLVYGLGLLTHYDTLVFAPTLTMIIVAICWKHRNRLRWNATHVVRASLTCVSMAAVFYVPYIRQPHFSEVGTYLIERVMAGKGLQTFRETYELLGLYLPPFYLLFAAPFLLLGIVHLVFRTHNVPSMVLVFWFVSGFSFYMLLGGDPRSHVYNYFIPGLILVACGIHQTIRLIGSRLQTLWERCVWVVIVAFTGTVYYMLVDHTIEHPWSKKVILGYTLPNLEDRHISGVFGFPYQRGLKEVGVLFRSGQLRSTFDSNERKAMADYYFHSARSERPDYYIHVHRPLSLERELPAFVTERYRKVREISVGGRRTIDIYEIVSHAEQ
jgi:4-amino-4-deoxy-L-arabinose transferase-like glycosyltransferase